MHIYPLPLFSSRYKLIILLRHTFNDLFHKIKYQDITKFEFKYPQIYKMTILVP